MADTACACPRRIVLATRSVRAGAGSSRIVLALARGLSAAGHRVAVVADRLDRAAVRRAGAEPGYPLGSAFAQRLGRTLCGRKVLAALRDRAVRRLRGDVVIGDGELSHQHVLLVHNIARCEVEALGAAATADHERVAARQEHSMACSSYDLVIANSELARAGIARRFGVPCERIAVVYPGFDPAQFVRAERSARGGRARATLGLASDALVVAFVCSGHFTLRGIDVLAATLAMLPAPARAAMHLLCVGSTRNAGLLRDALARSGVRVPIAFAPRSEHVQDYYHAADLLFHPAHFETFGLVVLEAAACGTPVLTSRAVGAAELFAGEGALAVAERPEAGLFAPVLERLLEDPPLRAAVAGSQHRAVSARTWPAYASAFMTELAARRLL